MSDFIICKKSEDGKQNLDIVKISAIRGLFTHPSGNLEIVVGGHPDSNFYVFDSCLPDAIRALRAAGWPVGDGQEVGR